ncbi:MAG: HD-GYP domain-containing protein, partial [Actinomycetota bacterium]
MRLDIDRKLLTSLLVMGSVVEARDPYTGGHLWRVAQFSRLLAEDAGMPTDQVSLVALGGFLHDLGKVGVPDAILNKPGKLTDDEYAVIKTHPEIGSSLLSEHPLGPLALDAVIFHHERPDGAGYPEGLAGDEIPLVARIVAISDTFDAMTSTRPYRRGMAVGKACDLLDGEAGRQFDAALLPRFLGLARAGRLDHVVGHSLDGARLAECPYCGPVIPTHGLEDGMLHHCRPCGGEFRLHRSGDGWVAEPTGNHAQPQELRPVPDFAPIRELAG